MFENITLGEKFTRSEKEACFLVDTQLFSVEIIMKTLFLYLDVCYVFLLRKEDGIYVQIIKKDTYKGTVDELLGNISNELLNTLLTEKVTKENLNIREEIVTRALGYSLKEAAVLNESEEQISASKSIDDLLKELDVEFDAK